MAADIRRDGVRSQGLWDALLGNLTTDVVASVVSATGRSALDVVDVGGGTGGLAVPLATLGHNVTVVDPSPDALAAAQRRAAEVAVSLSVVQGEAASVADMVGLATVDLVICHNVLEYVDSPADAMAGIARVLRPSGVVSVLASNAVAAVLHQALAGRFAEARRLLPDSVTGQPGGTAGDMTMTVDGMAPFVAGERALVFLRGRPDRASVVGMAQGKRVVRREPAGTRWMVRAPDRAGADFVPPKTAGGPPPVFERGDRPLADVRSEVLALCATPGGAR